MSSELRMFHQAGELYLSSLTAAWRREHLKNPSLWLARDPDAESKMLRNDVIGQAVDHRCALVAGREWQLVPRIAGDPCAPLAIAVGTEILSYIRKFSEARRMLARAFFHGSRYGEVEFKPKKLSIGDGRLRWWHVPHRILDQNQFRYRKVVTDHSGEHPQAHWERWKILGKDGGKWEPVSVREAESVIGHVFNNTEESLGYGAGLRERLGWPWFAMTHVNQEAIGAIERFARGWVHAKVANAAHAETGLPNSEVVSEWLAKLEDMQGRHVLVSSIGDEVDIKDGSATGWQMIDSFLERLESRVRTTVLSANLPTSANQGGSYALSQTQENSTDVMVRADQDALEETIDDDLMPAVWNKNRANLVELGLADCIPRYTITQDKIENPQEVATVGSTLHSMGVDLAADDLYDRTGFKKPEPGEDIIPGGAAAETPGGGFGLFRDRQRPRRGATTREDAEPFGVGVR